MYSHQKVRHTSSISMKVPMMPAHIKSTLIGVSQTIPIINGHLNLGLWQGLYLCEHRDDACSRTIIVTLQGE
jgi:secondary thiamine-phosphate synthase enzyme